jgi:hypothetical protein
MCLHAPSKGLDAELMGLARLPFPFSTVVPSGYIPDSLTLVDLHAWAHHRAYRIGLGKIGSCVRPPICMHGVQLVVGYGLYFKPSLACIKTTEGPWTPRVIDPFP